MFMFFYCIPECSVAQFFVDVGERRAESIWVDVSVTIYMLSGAGLNFLWCRKVLIQKLQLELSG